MRCHATFVALASVTLVDVMLVDVPVEVAVTVVVSSWQCPQYRASWSQQKQIPQKDPKNNNCFRKSIARS